MEYDEVTVKEKEIRTDSYFDGKIMEYIGYKLLAFLITIVTLTIAKPWADKLILEYKINHTVYNGKRLKFEGKGASLFVQRFKWIFFSIITLGIYSLWIPIKMEKWVVSNIHFEDEPFIEDESYFDGKLIQMIGVNLFTYLLSIISFGLLVPYTVCYKQRWIAKHTIINRKRIKFDGKAMSLIGHYILWWFLTIITLGIFSLWVPIKIYGWQVKRTHIKLKDEEESKTSKLPMFIWLILILVIIPLLVLLISKLEIPEIVSGDKPISEIFSNFGKNSTGEANLNSVQKGESYSIIWDTNGSGSTITETYKYGDTIKPKEPFTKEGYTFVRWEDQYGNEIKDGYVITGPIEIKSVWKKNGSLSNTSTKKPTTTTKKTKCNSGYVYVSLDNLCYSKKDYVSPETVHTIENGEIVASGIKCPKGYTITWESGLNGECYKTAKPNY